MSTMDSAQGFDLQKVDDTSFYQYNRLWRKCEDEPSIGTIVAYVPTPPMGVGRSHNGDPYFGVVVNSPEGLEERYQRVRDTPILWDYQDANEDPGSAPVDHLWEAIPIEIFCPECQTHLIAKDDYLCSSCREAS